jgi:hypothetical protein
LWTVEAAPHTWVALGTLIKEILIIELTNTILIRTVATLLILLWIEILTGLVLLKFHCLNIAEVWWCRTVGKTKDVEFLITRFCLWKIESDQNFSRLEMLLHYTHLALNDFCIVVCRYPKCFWKIDFKSLGQLLLQY